MTLLEILTLGIAGWGAILSTVLAVGEWQRRKTHLKVKFDLCSFTPLDGEESATAHVTITNHGEKPVVLDGLYFRREKPKGAVMQRTTNGVTFPYQLEPGTKLVVTYAGQDLMNWIAKSERPEDRVLRAVCHDSLGKKYFSNREDFDQLDKLRGEARRLAEADQTPPHFARHDSQRGDGVTRLQESKITSEKPESPVLFWAISCFDKRREKPFPVYQRWYWLDWAKLSPEDAEAILAIVEDQKPVHPSGPDGLGESVTTFHFGHVGADERWLQYRHLFSEVPENDFATFTKENQVHSWRMVQVPGEYFEDETGTRITQYEMIQHVTGREFPIIIGDPESIMRLGAVDPINTDKWSEDKANAIAQFLDVVTRIWQSQWLRRPLSISARQDASGTKELLEATLPDDHDTMAVLAYFRQLHAGDKVLASAVDAYVAHCGDGRKIHWVNERKHSFNKLVDSPPMFDTGGKTRREVLRMFMYGARLLHGGEPHGGSDAELAALISRLGKHQTIMMFNMCLRDFYGISNHVYHVLRQDFDHWINACGLTGPTRTEIRDLFTGYRKEDGNSPEKI